MTYVELDIWIRDPETKEFIRKILTGSIKLDPKNIEIWVNELLEYKEEDEDNV